MPSKAKTSKKSGTKPKRKQQAQPRAKPARQPTLPVGSWAMETCSVTNPFCTEAIGSRWPDNSFTKSNGWGFQDYPQPANADVNGSGALLLSASLYNPVHGAAITGTTANYTFTGVAPVTPPSCSRFRVVSYGLRITSALSKMTATGNLHIRLFSPEYYATVASNSLTSTMCDASYDIPLSRLIDKDFFVIPMPLGTNARLFTPVDSPTEVISTQPNLGWQMVQVGFTGAPANSVPITVYLYYHYEIIPADGDATNAFAKAPPKNNPAVQAANAGVLESVGNFFEGAADKLDKVIKSKAARIAGAAAAAFYGRPDVAGALMIRDMD